MLFLTILFVGVTAAAGQTAVWGGEHVQMEVAARGAELEFDCATGTITEPLPDDGAFSVKGTFSPEHGGPSRDEAPAVVDATYSGTIKGDTLTLHIVLAGNDRREMDYVLVRGRRGNVRKCR